MPCPPHAAATASSPVYQYHLGLAYLKNGNRPLAEKALRAAVSANVNFAGLDDARETLRSLETANR